MNDDGWQRSLDRARRQFSDAVWHRPFPWLRAATEADPDAGPLSRIEEPFDIDAVADRATDSVDYAGVAPDPGMTDDSEQGGNVAYGHLDSEAATETPGAPRAWMGPVHRRRDRSTVIVATLAVGVTALIALLVSVLALHPGRRPAAPLGRTVPPIAQGPSVDTPALSASAPSGTPPSVSPLSGVARLPGPASPTPRTGTTTKRSGNSPQPSAPQWTEVVVQATIELDWGQSIQSNRTRLTMQSDGNLAIFDEHNQVRWTSGTGGLGGYRAVFQADGNLVVYDQNWQSLWVSGTAGNSGAVLALMPDGATSVLCTILRSSGRAIRPIEGEQAGWP